ncbi:hypothetical protein A3K64_01675 [Candidatus Micrarchaeota archaeon RBG_16_36_9]|nr:MAG: hypothetical protein A3K64_01675 [Candidatus Micrarchaeota archaeon RBG_16_36_9]
MKTGVADLPLHYGSCPKWLFPRMKKLGRAVTEIIVLEFGRDEFLRRISDPFFFQSFGCVLGFDWHSSGLTTTVTGALKEGLGTDLGLTVLGGKGRASRKTPSEIDKLEKIFSLSSSKIEELKYASRLAAKVDNNCIQAGFVLYHHSFFVSEDGKWAVVQQGMSNETGYARRYHWLSEKVKSFVVEPHVAICCDTKSRALNMVAEESEESRKVSVDMSKENPNNLKKYLLMDTKHEIDLKNYKPLMNAYEFQPKNYEELVALKGLGARSIRALALMSKLVYGTEPSWRDPVKFSFSHGGKDGFPHPVDRGTYDKSIEILKTALENAKIDDKEKIYAFKRLNEFIPKEFK